MIKGYAHVCISASDLKASERFYCTQMGLKKIFNFIRNGQVIGFYLELANKAYLEVFEQEKTQENGKCPIRHFCIEVDDMDKWVESMRKKGIQVADKKLGADQSWQAWVTDPSGVRIEFHQYTPNSCQTTRADCVLP